MVMPLRVSLMTILFALSAAPFLRAGEHEILQRVDELQKIARRTNGGAMGCGMGFVTLITSKGEVKAACGLDPIHVFGKRIAVLDLHVLLQSRADANATGKQGPMSGEVSDLCYVCLDTLALAKDPDSIPVIASLLEDKNDVVRGWATIALFRMGQADDQLRKRIEAIEFPKSAIASARSRANPPPSWVIEKNDVEPGAKLERK